MIIRHRFRRHVLMNTTDGGDALGGGGGGAVEQTVDHVEVISSPAPAPAAAASAPSGPKSLLEAVSSVVPAPAPAASSPGQPRDELGRFTFKDAAGNAVDAQGNRAPNGAQAAPDAQPAPVQTELPVDDPLAMPEGLGQKAQERFQKLANTNKELTTQLEQASSSLRYVQEQFQQNGIQQEQFEQFTAFAGLINRGDFAGAQRILMEQLQQVALLSGQPMTMVDPLAAYPDLRQRVDTLQISEADAVEIAQARQRESLQQQAAQRTQQAQQQQRQEQQAQQAQQQAVDKGLLDIEAFCKQMKASDLDYQAIEDQLMPIVQDLIKDLPPERWGAMIRTQYNMIKNTASRVRQQAPAAGTVLRPTGQASPSAAPRSMHEAMWGGSPRA